MGEDQFLNNALRTAREAAAAAGQVIRAQYMLPRQIKEKGPRDLVTDTDHLAQAAAVEVIRARYPDHGVLAEEDSATHSTHEGRWTIPDGPLWLIDPLDGTTNFANSIPMLCVSVGLAVDQQCVVGAIYDPYRDEMFSAARGGGAWLNDQPLPRINAVPLHRSVVAVDWAHHPSIRTRAVALVGELAPLCQTVRALGTAALAQAYVAAGRVQFYFNFGLQPWDVGAGAVLITEAGGALLQPDGSAWMLGQPAMIAGHPDLLNEIPPLVSDPLE